MIFHLSKVGVDDIKKELLDKGVEGVGIWVFESLNFELDAIKCYRRTASSWNELEPIPYSEFNEDIR